MAPLLPVAMGNSRDAQKELLHLSEGCSALRSHNISKGKHSNQSLALTLHFVNKDIHYVANFVTVKERVISHSMDDAYAY